MTDFETHPVGTAARIAELGGANGVHILRSLSKQEMVEVEKMAADGKFQEAAQKFGGQVTYHQDQRDLPPMADAELALHLRGGLVPMSVAYRAASRIEQLVATVEQLEAALTRANAATAAAYEVAAATIEMIVSDAQKEVGSIKLSKVDAAVVEMLNGIAAAIRALVTPDQTAALDTLVAEAVGPLLIAAKSGLRFIENTESELGIILGCGDSLRNALLAASKKGGV